MKKIMHRVRRAKTRLITKPARIANERIARRVFKNFAKKHKLLYFAEVDNLHKESRIVRGLTLGLSKKDTHHAIGSHNSYDIACVYRYGKPETGYLWTVMEADLHTAVNLPHIIIGKKTEVKQLIGDLMGIHRHLSEHNFAQPDDHHTRFKRSFIAYASPAHASLVEHIISPELTNSLVDHLDKIVIEIEGDSIYLAVNNPRLSVAYLDKLMHYTLEFARHTDERMGAS